MQFQTGIDQKQPRLIGRTAGTVALDGLDDGAIPNIHVEDNGRRSGFGKRRRGDIGHLQSETSGQMPGTSPVRLIADDKERLAAAVQGVTSVTGSPTWTLHSQDANTPARPTSSPLMRTESRKHFRHSPPAFRLADERTTPILIGVFLCGETSHLHTLQPILTRHVTSM